MNNKHFIILISIILKCNIFGQIHSGIIQYERKTNLFKKFPEMKEDFEKWNIPKIKTDLFTLYFNDTISNFGPSIDVTSLYFGYWTRSNS